MLNDRPVVVVLLTLLYLQVSAENVINPNPSLTSEKSDKSEYKKSLSRDCANSYTVTCLKLDIVSWVDKLNEEDSYSVMPGVSLVRENESARSSTADIVVELARDFPNDPETRLDTFLLRKVMSYLSSHSVRLDLFDRGNVNEARGGGGGIGGGGGGGGKGGGGGGGNGMGMMMAAGVMMKGVLYALALGGIAAIAGKALMAALMSLVLSAIIGLKSLTHHGEKSTTYEIVAKPIYTHSQSHSEVHEPVHYGHSSYGRSFDMPLPLGLHPEYKPA